MLLGQLPDLRDTQTGKDLIAIGKLEGKLEGKLDYPLAALVMPATIDHIRAVSLHQERMPAKSTYFYPKLLSGLVFHALE